MEQRITKVANAAEVVETVADEVVAAITRAYSERGTAHVALTGGGTGQSITRSLAEFAHEVSWNDVQLWWGDERFVPRDHDDRNDREGLEGLSPLLTPFGQSPIVHRWPSARSPEPGASEAHHAAQTFETHLAEAFDTTEVPQFDVVILGVGEDGHVASLFPHDLEAAVNDPSWVRSVMDSPKPPPARLTLGMSLLVAAREVFIATAGAGKSTAIAQAIVESGRDPVEATLPLGYLTAMRPCRWIIDDEAATDL